MEKKVFLMMIKREKNFNKVTKEIIKKHVDNLRILDNEGKIKLCGPLSCYPGMAGLVIFQTDSYEEAQDLCRQEPLVALGYATYILAELQLANKENNYLY